MIPKIIHYCWFGRNPKPKIVQKCIKSWKKYCPDYQIIEWNEDNVDIGSAPAYIAKALENGMWAYVSDYFRYKAVFDNGGIYFDTDVELIKSLDPLLDNKFFLGFDDLNKVGSGLGFGSEKEYTILGELLDLYTGRKVDIIDGKPKIETNVIFEEPYFIRKGIVLNGEMQEINGIKIYPSEYFCPARNGAAELKITNNTFSIHWFSGSWLTEQQKKEAKEFRRKTNIKHKIHYITHLPNRLLKKCLGNDKYDKLKTKFSKNR